MDFQALADRIDTGLENPERSRALIVFNPTLEPLGGIALFSVDMPWRCGVPLPPIWVKEVHGDAVPSLVTDFLVTDSRNAPDTPEEEVRCRARFSLLFSVAEIPARGWVAYIAEYADQAAPQSLETKETPAAGLIVVETLRHRGDLPAFKSHGF